MTDREIKQVKTTPDPFESFNLSQAMIFGDLVFVSGQAALDLEGNIIKREKQTDRRAEKFPVPRFNSCSHQFFITRNP